MTGALGRRLRKHGHGPVVIPLACLCAMAIAASKILIRETVTILGTAKTRYVDATVVN